MKIKYVGGSLNVTISDVLDPRFNTWDQGETKDVPDYDISVLNLYGNGNMRNAIEAVLNAGPIFVDESTGLNPLFTCTKPGCKNPLDHDFFRPNHANIDYVDANGRRV